MPKKMKMKMRKRHGRRTTTVELPATDTKVESDVLPGAESTGPMGEVSVALGLTIGLPRKFEFARIDVSSRLPHEDSDNAREAAYKRAYEFSKKKIAEEVQAIRVLESEKKEEKADG